MGNGHNSESGNKSWSRGCRRKGYCWQFWRELASVSGRAPNSGLCANSNESETESITLRTALSPLSSRERLILPVAGVYLTALSSRIFSNCCRAALSPATRSSRDGLRKSQSPGSHDGAPLARDSSYRFSAVDGAHFQGVLA
jgi:hypothetical protein